MANEVPLEGWTWVRVGDRVGVAPAADMTHEDLAKADRLFDPHWLDEKPGVSDGGLLFAGLRNELIIPTHFSDSTRVMEVQRAIEAHGDVNAVRKQVRLESGQKIANLTGRPVRVKYEDGTEEVLQPQG